MTKKKKTKNNEIIMKMGREEGVFKLSSQPPLVIVCHELIIWRLSIYGSAMV